MGTSFSDRLDGQALLMIIISDACPPKKRCAESLYPFIPLIVFGMGIVVYICKQAYVHIKLQNQRFQNGGQKVWF